MLGRNLWFTGVASGPLGKSVVFACWTTEACNNTSSAHYFGHIATISLIQIQEAPWERDLDFDYKSLITELRKTGSSNSDDDSIDASRTRTIGIPVDQASVINILLLHITFTLL